MNLASKLRSSLGVQSVPPNKTFGIEYGHTETHVIVVFPQAVPNVVLRPEEVDAMIKGLTIAKEALEKHRGG